MEFKITGRHIDITDAMREHAKTKTARLTRYYDRIQEIHVIVKPCPQKMEVELIVDVEHHDDFVAHFQHDDLYIAIDGVVNKMERQLTDHKEKLRNHKHSTN